MSSVSEPRIYDVFLSHGSPDKPWVRNLYTALTAAGVTAYLDEVAIDAGDNFVCNLSNGVGHTSTFVIVVSQGTMDRAWVEHEWTSFMATHGPKNRIIPVLLDDVRLPPFLRPFQAIHVVDRNVETVASRIARAVGKGGAPVSPGLYTGQNLIFTIASVSDGDQLVVTSADGVQRTVTPFWRQGNAFGLALRDFEQHTRESLDDAARTRLFAAAQTLGSALFHLLFSDDALLSTFARATAPGARAIVTVQSDEDVLLSLPWELLFHNSRFLVRDGVLDVVRSTTTAVQFETQLTPPSEPFSVVTHISAPEGSALRYEEESFRVTHALTDHCPQTATELGTLEDLVKTVTDALPRGIHFSGHGAPGMLVFEDDEGFEDRIAIGRLVTALRQQSDGALPPFFFLASCHGNTPAKPTEGQSGSSSSAAQLHREGVTEVVGYYGPIADELSTRAEEALYAAIAGGEPTRLAVAKARAALQRTFDANVVQRPTDNAMSSGTRGPAAPVHSAPFAWAQLVFYRRGPEYPLGTPASQGKLRQREASLKRTYRNVADRAFLDTGFIGRRQELHQLRRRCKRGDRVFVLQGLGGLGKTTLAGHLLPMLAETEHTVAIWCRRTEGELDQAEALVGQLLSYARARFGAGFEQVVSDVDRAAGDDAPQRFGAFLQEILAQQANVPLVVYLDNLESLLQGAEGTSTNTAPDPDAFGAWRTETVQHLWRALLDLTTAVEHLYVVASCRYRNDDLMAGLLSISPLADADLFRLMAWFPALRRLSTPSRARLATRLSGHPRAVEFLDALMAYALRSWEDKHGEWSPPASSDQETVAREWEQLVAPALPEVQARIWSDLLLAALWDRVLDERARRMLFRMTLLRRPWDDALLPHLGDVEDDVEVAPRTARTLAATSLLEQIVVTFRTRDGQPRGLLFTVHAATAAFARGRFGDALELRVASHSRLGTYLEEKARTSTDLTVDLEAGYHLFEAGEYDRAYRLLGEASDSLRRWGRTRESLQLLLPFLAEPAQLGMDRILVGELLTTIGNADFVLGEIHPAIELYEQSLVICREIGDRRGEGIALGNMGNAYAALGETRRAIELSEQQLVIARETGDRRGEGGALSSLADAYFLVGETRRAIELSEQRLVISREIGDRQGEGIALGNLGNAYYALDETRRAIELYEQQLVIAREIGNRRDEGIAIANLGNAYYVLGEIHPAIELYEQSLVICREIGDRRGEGDTLGSLGQTYAALGEPRRAIDFLEKSLSIGQAISDPRIISFAEKGLKHCAAAR